MENNPVVTDHVVEVFDSVQGRNKETPYDLVVVSDPTFNSVLISNESKILGRYKAIKK